MGNRGGSVQKTWFIKLDLIKEERKQTQWREILIKGGGLCKGEKITLQVRESEQLSIINY